MNASFSQHCRKQIDSPQGLFASTEKANEAASDNGIYLLCHWSRANYSSVGYALSNAFYTGPDR